jgi:glycerol-3-phosphate dehydrogenase
MTRQEIIAALRNNPKIPVLIVGGGINGVGVFRELAAQGVDVLLVEQGDFCQGTSAASSHMLHGGLRYLENAEFRLVREALRERNRLLKNAPHYALPAPTLIPIFRWTSGLLNAPLKFLRLLDRPSERGLIIIKMGLTIYDWFTRKNRVMPTHKIQMKTASLAKNPALNADIIATAVYYDAWMPTPERICMELVMDAEGLHNGAHALNYMSLQSGDGDTVTLHDELTGEALLVQPRLVVNAAGPWIDLANDAMGQNTRFIGGTKGSHLVVDHPDLYAATQGQEIFFENLDGRITLFFPLEDRVLMGTTDIPVDSPEDAICTPEETDYILGMVEKVFPKINVTHDDIVFKFCGVRPLPASDVDRPGQISRDHHIEVTQTEDFPVYSLVGGKWTTFRAFGEQTADKVLEALKRARRVSTAEMPIGGGKDYPADDAAKKQWISDLAEESGLNIARINVLFKRYGTCAADIAAFIRAEPGDRPLNNLGDYSTREVIFITRYEKVMRLSDFVFRRSLMAMLGCVTRPLLDELAEVVGTELGWTSEEQAAEVEYIVKLLRERHDVHLD